MHHKRAHDRQRTFRIMTTTAATEHNIRLIVENIITSHAGIACHVEHNAQSTLPHYGSACWLVLSCVWRALSLTECIALGKMSGGHYLPNRVTGSQKALSVQNPKFLRSQVDWSKTMNLRLFITAWNRRLLVWCTIVNTSINSLCFCESMLLGRKCVQFEWFPPIPQYLDDVRLETTVFG